MRIVIDISKDRYDEIMSMDWKNCRRFFDEEIRAIHDGKALEQEPKTDGDCISRQAVLNIVDSYSNSQSNVEDVIQDCISDVIALPSVQPKVEQKTGYWIPVYQGDEIINYRCSECEFGNTFGKKPYGINYCPNCGTKMEG